MGHFKKLTTNVYGIGSFAAIAGIMFGFDIGSNSGVIATKQYRDYFNNPNDILQGGINGSLSAGCFIGALCSGIPADRYSRKYTLVAASFLFIIGSAFQASSNGVPLLILGRVINGFSVGITSMVVPLYQSEMAPKEIRGRVVSVQQWSITWGIMISFWIQYGCQFIDSTLAFRIPWAIQAVPAIILCCGMWAFPFSPRWLADQGRLEEARQVIADIHGEGDRYHPRVQTEMEEIEAMVQFDRNIASHRYADILKPDIIYRVFLGIMLQIYQQLTGMNIIMFYVVFLFEQVGVGSSQKALLVSSGVSYIVNVIMTIPAIVFVDRWGRRPTLVIGAFMMSVLLWCVGGILARGEWSTNVETGKANVSLSTSAEANGVVACIYLFVATFATTWGAVGWIYPAEIYPLRVRAIAISLSTASNWLFNWLLNFMVPVLMERIHYGLYFLFAAFNFIMFVHVFISYPETKGYTLEEMEVIFQHNPRKRLPRQVIDDWVASKRSYQRSQMTVTEKNIFDKLEEI